MDLWTSNLGPHIFLCKPPITLTWGLLWLQVDRDLHGKMWPQGYSVVKLWTGVLGHRDVYCVVVYSCVSACLLVSTRTVDHAAGTWVWHVLSTLFMWNCWGKTQTWQSHMDCTAPLSPANPHWYSWWKAHSSASGSTHACCIPSATPAAATKALPSCTDPSGTWTTTYGTPSTAGPAIVQATGLPAWSHRRNA